MLRVFVILVAAALALTAGVQLAMGRPYGWLAIGIEALLVIVLVVFERSRYRPRVSTAGTWRPTGERFRDPVTGELVDVYAEQQSGARDYRPGARTR